MADKKNPEPIGDIIRENMKRLRAARDSGLLGGALVQVMIPFTPDNRGWLEPGEETTVNGTRADYAGSRLRL